MGRPQADRVRTKFTNQLLRCGQLDVMNGLHLLHLIPSPSPFTRSRTRTESWEVEAPSRRFFQDLAESQPLDDKLRLASQSPRPDLFPSFVQVPEKGGQFNCQTAKGRSLPTLIVFLNMELAVLQPGSPTGSLLVLNGIRDGPWNKPS